VTASKDGPDEVPAENILRVTDELVRQVDRTKKLVVVMIVAVVVAIPAAWHISPLISGSPWMVAGYITVVIAIVFLAVGIRQWAVLSKWTKRYKQYKALQEKVDRQLDFESEPSGNKVT
jgi:hypothetical protein